MSKEFLAIWAGGPPFFLLATWPYLQAIISVRNEISRLFYDWINIAFLAVLSMLVLILHSKFLRTEPWGVTLAFLIPYLFVFITYTAIYLRFRPSRTL